MDHYLSKFRGAFLGGLVGDCLGAPFETMWLPVSFNQLEQLDKRIKCFKPTSSNPWLLHYTDDTEMAHAMSGSIVQEQSFSAMPIARIFAVTYFQSPPQRYYGGSVPTVFNALRSSNYTGDPYAPARAQFNGEGSFGNGSGMRVFPIALFCFKDMDMLKELAGNSARLTHSHVDAVNGAILQAAAVHFAMESDSQTTWLEIWHKLNDLCLELEPEASEREKPYCDKLDKIHQFISDTEPIDSDKVSEDIGNGIMAKEAIPAAIFSFLCCLAGRQPSDFKVGNLFQQVVFYAISLGGDTDTIGTMAGAIAGAFCGEEAVPKHWVEACEGKDRAASLAGDLHNLYVQRVNQK